MSTQTNTQKLSAEILRLHKIMQDLRDPKTGCPWDVEQTFETIAPYTIEEAYEVADAITSGNRKKIAEELGDLLLQVVFHSQIAAEEGSFDMADVAAGISDKMIRRHPHVFSDDTRPDAQGQKQRWEDIKAQERSDDSAGAPVSVLDGISNNLPAIMRAVKLQKRAARVGFDWPHIDAVLAKMDEETAELKEAMEGPSPDAEHIADEVGDILFVATNIARKAGVDPETALLGCNRKFETRFRFIETELGKQDRTLEDASLEEMEALWQDAKQAGKS